MERAMAIIDIKSRREISENSLSKNISFGD